MGCGGRAGLAAASWPRLQALGLPEQETGKSGSSSEEGLAGLKGRLCRSATLSPSPGETEPSTGGNSQIARHSAAWSLESPAERSPVAPSLPSPGTLGRSALWWPQRRTAAGVAQRWPPGLRSLRAGAADKRDSGCAESNGGATGSLRKYAGQRTARELSVGWERRGPVMR